MVLLNDVVQPIHYASGFSLLISQLPRFFFSPLFFQAVKLATRTSYTPACEHSLTTAAIAQ